MRLAFSHVSSCALLLLLASAATSAQDPGPADLILRGGKVFLGPGQYAEAVAVAGNRILAVGTNGQILALKGEKTRVVDLAGRAVTPGFHDAHAHFLKGALSLTEPSLQGAASLAEIQGRLLDHLTEHPETEWVTGRGWDLSAFPGRNYPTRQDLDAVISTRPAALADADGRALWLNSEALRRCGITARAHTLSRGTILMERGEPAGVLLDEALSLLKKCLPEPDRAAKLAALRQALALARRLGITSVQSLPGPLDSPAPDPLELWRELNASGEFTLRYFLYGSLEAPGAVAKLRSRGAEFPRTRLDFVGVKGFVDGFLSARTAALLEPYFDAPKSRGRLEHLGWRLNSLVREAHRQGLRVSLHAAGDAAARAALDACQRSEEASRREGLVLPVPPCKLEHLEVLNPKDMGRFKELNAAASLQPGHMAFESSAKNHHPNRLAERVRHSFAARALEEAGALLAFGSDWPAAPLDPRLGLFAVTTRQHLDGRPAEGWVPRQRISLESAVQHYTFDPARAIGREEELGSIAPGKLADLVVFAGDLFAAGGLDILKVEIDLTLFDGKVVYERRPAWKP